MLSVKDIANEFGCSRSKAYKIIQLRGFPAMKLGKNYYVDEELFKKWKSENMCTEIKL